jgi:peptide-methionine (S)-S-oxide reductase
MLNMFRKIPELPGPEQALPGRNEPIPTAEYHYVNQHPLKPPYPEGLERALFGLGCFWGAERKFWQVPGVWVTAVGYAGGHTPNPTYDEVCSGQTGHAEVVLVVYEPDRIGYSALLKLFFESHNPTQGMRQGNDVGTQYRSVLYVFNEEQARLARLGRDTYQTALVQAGRLGEITTEIADAPAFFFAEAYHQQYLAKNPAGYCGLGGMGVEFDCVGLTHNQD